MNRLEPIAKAGFMTLSDGHRVHYVVSGPEDAPIVLFSNSLSTDLSMWDPQASALAARYRVVRYDTRGHGRSAVPEGRYSIDRLADDTAALMDGLGIRRAHVVGLSLGGMTGQVLALRRPDLVQSLVLAATTCMPPYHGPEVWEDRISHIRARGNFDDMLEPMMDRWLSLRFRRRDPEAYRRVRQMVLATAPQGYIGCCHAIAGFDVRDRLHAVQVPTLVISAEEDPGTTVEDGQMIHEAIAGSEFAVIPIARHLANVDRPELFTPLLLDFLERNSVNQ